MYVKFNVGCHFGVLDIISYFVENEELDAEKWSQYQDGLKRNFTAQCKQQSEIMTLPIEDLQKIQTAFKDCYDNLFNHCF